MGVFFFSRTWQALVMKPFFNKLSYQSGTSIRTNAKFCPMTTFAWCWTWYKAGMYLLWPQVPYILVLVLPQVIWYIQLVCSSIPSTHTSTIYPRCPLYVNATLVNTERGKAINRCHQLNASPGWGESEPPPRNAPPWMDGAWTGEIISLGSCSQITPDSRGF
jgi:hypothetical protein